MRSPGVVFHPLLFDHDLRLLQRVKDLPVQALIPQLSVKALAVAILPGTARLDVQRARSDLPQPLPQFLGHEPGHVPESDAGLVAPSIAPTGVDGAVDGTAGGTRP